MTLDLSLCLQTPNVRHWHWSTEAENKLKTCGSECKIVATTGTDEVRREFNFLLPHSFCIEELPD